MVFKSTQLAIFAEDEVMEAVNSKMYIRVGLADDDVDALRAKHGPVMIYQTLKAWSMLISSIQCLPVLTQILTAASPSEGWQIFDKYYQLKAAAEKSKLTQQCHRFCSETNQTPHSYFGRFAVLYSGLASHGTIFSDTDAHYHLVQNLSPVFSIQKSIILTHSDLAM